MPKGDFLKAGLRQRILNSEITLEVHYPDVRPAVNTGVPTTAPTSPLTGPRTTEALLPVATTVGAESVTIPCLWLDASSVMLQPQEAINAVSPVGWREGAQVMARVLVEQAALSPDKPHGGTVFDAADVIISNTKRYRLMGVELIGTSFTEPTTYAVWLKGSARN
jgi:hypothetical protein